MRKRLKKVQKKINKTVHSINKSIKNDWLWNGRFYYHQVKYNYYSFEDGSGGIFYVLLNAIDRKTNRQKLYSFEYINGSQDDKWFNGQVFWKMNEFITRECGVWEEKPDPYEQAHMEGRFCEP